MKRQRKRLELYAEKYTKATWPGCVCVELMFHVAIRIQCMTSSFARSRPFLSLFAFLSPFLCHLDHEIFLLQVQEYILNVSSCEQGSRSRVRALDKTVEESAKVNGRANVEIARVHLAHHGMKMERSQPERNIQILCL